MYSVKNVVPSKRKSIMLLNEITHLLLICWILFYTVNTKRERKKNTHIKRDKLRASWKALNVNEVVRVIHAVYIKPWLLETWFLFVSVGVLLHGRALNGESVRDFALQKRTSRLWFGRNNNIYVKWTCYLHFRCLR